jgi:hypothetical protein
VGRQKFSPRDSNVVERGDSRSLDGRVVSQNIDS